jgi:hypothetical protein
LRPHAAVIGRSRRRLKLPNINHWNASCTDIRKGAIDPPNERKKKTMMKIYFLVLLVGAIAAASHVEDQRKSPEPAA